MWTGIGIGIGGMGIWEQAWKREPDLIIKKYNSPCFGASNKTVNID